MRRTTVSLLAATMVVSGVTATAPLLATGTAAATTPVGVATPTVPAPAVPTPKGPVAEGVGGAVASVDADASAAGLTVLRRGGNAVDAAVATAAALGVTEPYSAGVGGGGFMVIYNAATGRVHTIDGRETAPAAMQADAFLENGQPIPFDQAVTSGLSVGVPGTPRTWETALQRFGTMSTRDVLRPAIGIAERGFVADQTYTDQTAGNAARFRDFTSSAELYLEPDGTAPQPGTVVTNPDLADTYRLMAREGINRSFYRGPIGRAVAQTAQQPPQVAGSTRTVRPGLIKPSDIRFYDAPLRRPTAVDYRGLDVYGMAPPSSGGSTVGEALNILEGFDLGGLSRPEALHRYLEASALAFADRGRYVGDSDYTKVPLSELLSKGFAADRRACINPTVAAAKPVAAGVPSGAYDGACGPAASPYDNATEGLSTTHLTTADRYGNVVAYTLTIESTGGSGIAVPGYGFLLNNELTDFDFGPAAGPNRPGPGKRPRSSMSPTIVLQDGEPVLALGSPGGATIITTVLQVLVEHLDLGRSLPEAVAAPRASQRNSASPQAEPEFIAADGPSLAPFGHRFTPVAEIGAVTGIALDGGHMQAVAEPARRGGGSAVVVRPRPW